MRKISLLAVWVLIFQLLFSALLILPSSCANPLTEVTLDLQDEPPKVDVSPGSAGIVTAHGTVTCEKWGPDLVKVFLFANSTLGSASVVPASLTFSGSAGSVNVDTFYVDTRVPMGTSFYEEIFFSVDGYYDQGGMRYEIEPVSIEIIILQYYRVDVFFNGGESREKKSTTIKSGESVNLDFIVHNAGNGNDKFEVDFLNREERKQEGFDLPDPITISIPEKRNESVSWSIGTSEDMSGVYPLKMSVISKGSKESGQNISLTKHIYIRIEERTVTDRIGAILLSPLVILLIIVMLLVIIVIWYKRRG
jgi:hypothetical protein